MVKIRSREILLYVVVAIALVVSFSFAFMDNGHTEAKYERAVNAEQADICSAPPGYSEAEWKEHMSHHPDRYGECL